MNAGSPHLAAASSFSGTDRFVAEYLRSEFLDRVSRSDVLFLTRTSILDRMCGPLCDATVGRTGSSRVLHRLEQRNLLVIPIDRDGEWYRYHHLFRELLHAELMRREPEMVRELHLRAAAWYEANDLPEAAIEPCATRRRTRISSARLVLTLANPVWASGRLDTVLRWMQWFADNELIEEQPAVAVHGALMLALVGNAADAERWADGRAAHDTDGNALRREHDGRHARLPADADLPRRPGGDAPRRADARSRDSARRVPIDPRCCTPKAPRTSSAATQTWRTAVSCRPSRKPGSTGALPFIPLLLAERGIARDRPGRLVVGRGARVTGTRDRAARVRRLLDECARPMPGLPAWLRTGLI